MPRTLYICYFGLREPLVQTQVLPYLRELVKGERTLPGRASVAVSLLTFEPELSKKWTSAQVEQTRLELQAQGITWQALPYHKRFSALATSWDILRGTLLVRRLISEQRIDVLHGRVHVPTLMGAAARRLSRRKPKLLFDIRGFFPEEYTDAGVWPQNGVLYRSAKRVERWLMSESDAFVVLTEKAREVLFPDASTAGRPSADAQLGNASNGTAGGWRDRHGRPVEVIPCCVDFTSRFQSESGAARAAARRRLRVEDRFVITHVGALGGLYLTEQIVELIAAARARNPKTFALFLTQTAPERIVPLLRQHGLGEADYFVGKVPPSEMQQYLSAADVALSFVKASYATLSRSPTKIPEYLACGLPIIANRGVGDVDSLIEDNGVGAIVDELSEVSYLAALRKVEELGDISEKCREVARRSFALESVGGERYRRVYRRLLDAAF